MPKITLKKLLYPTVIMVMGISIAIMTTYCGGGGGGGGSKPPETKDITITGKVDVGAEGSPVKNALCHLVNTDGVEKATATTNADGEFSMNAPSDVAGYLNCSPTNLSNLTLSTYCTTQGLTADDTINDENVTPFTTVVTQIIKSEDAVDPVARKQELLAAIASAQDPYLNLVVELSTRLYVTMLKHNLDVNFADNQGEAGGDSNGDGGGAGGDAGDGGDFSPLPEATCEFVVDNNLSNGRSVLYNAALADFYGDGKLNRPDLAEIQEEINAAFAGREQEIIAAFENLFPSGPGRSYTTKTDENGSYFLPIPPNVSGFVRCTPKDQDKLVLATYIPPRPPGESLVGQDVNPATTLFSAKIVSKLHETHKAEAKENYLQNINGLDVQILHDNESVSGFQLRPGTAPSNKDVGLVAFSATSLFNILYKNDLNVDYLAALEDFTAKQRIDPDFLISQGVETGSAHTYSGMVDESVNQTEATLGTNLDAALSSAQINVTATDISGGEPQPGITVNILEDVTCEGCGTETDANGQVTLTLSNISDEVTDITVVASEPGGNEASVAVQVVALSTIDLEVAMTPSFDLTLQGIGEGSGEVISDTGGINCAMDGTVENGTCNALFTDGTAITLTAVASEGSLFSGWSGTSCSGTDPSCTITMDQAHSVSASFALQCIDANNAISPTTTHFNAGGGVGRIDVSAPSDCDWSASANDDWVTITSENSGRGDGTVTYSVPVNIDLAERTATITVAGRTHTITQAERQCTADDYSILPERLDFSASEATGTIQVNAPTGCPWSAVTDTNWITITSGQSGNGNGTVTYTIPANTNTTESRTGIISVADGHHTVFQEAPAPTPEFTLAIQGGGSGNGTVNSNSGNIACTISASQTSGVCSAAYPTATQVTLTAAITGDSIFQGWRGGGCVGSNPTCTVTMDQAQAVTAVFSAPFQADLVVESFTYNGMADYVPIGTAIGDRIGLTIRNTGSSAVGTFSVGFYISSDNVITTEDRLLTGGREFVESIAAGTSVTVPLAQVASIPADMEPSSVFLGVMIDEGNTIDETNETNNTASIQINLRNADTGPAN